MYILFYLKVFVRIKAAYLSVYMCASFPFSFEGGISSVIRRSFSPFQNNQKDLDPSYKTDLDLWDC